MPIWDLQIAAELENIEEISADSDVRYYMRVRCSNCGEESGDFIYVEPANQETVGRATVNFLLRCKGCRRENTIDLVPRSQQSYKSKKAPGYETIASFDCRGLEPTAWEPNAGFVAVANGGKARFEVFPPGGTEDFCDYDQDGEQAVGIYNLKGKFVARAR